MKSFFLNTSFGFILMFLVGCGNLQMNYSKLRTPYQSGQWASSQNSGEWSAPSFQSPTSEPPESNAGLVRPDPKKPFTLRWPVKKVRISQSFRPRHNSSHEGIDLTHYYKAPIYAAHYGHVIYKGSQFRGYGRMIIVEYNNKWASLYGHLEEILVNEGDIVKSGQKIATMGNTGRSSGTHLHFELLKNRVPVNPLLYLQSRGSIAKK